MLITLVFDTSMLPHTGIPWMWQKCWGEWRAQTRRHHSGWHEHARTFAHNIWNLSCSVEREEIPLIYNSHTNNSSFVGSRGIRFAHCCFTHTTHRHWQSLLKGAQRFWYFSSFRFVSFFFFCHRRAVFPIQWRCLRLRLKEICAQQTCTTRVLQ